MSETERLMSLAEVAEYLNLKERTIYQWSQQGKLPSFKLGNVWRYRKEDIELWIEEQQRKTPRSRKVQEVEEKSDD